MKLDLILETINSMPTATFALILFMSLSAALLVNHILRVGIYTTIFAIPSLLFAGMFAQATFVAHNIYISPDKASNTAIAVCTGFITLAACGILVFRMYAAINDRN